MVSRHQNRRTALIFVIRHGHRFPQNSSGMRCYGLLACQCDTHRNRLAEDHRRASHSPWPYAYRLTAYHLHRKRKGCAHRIDGHLHQAPKDTGSTAPHRRAHCRWRRDRAHLCQQKVKMISADSIVSAAKILCRLKGWSLLLRKVGVLPGLLGLLLISSCTMGAGGGGSTQITPDSVKRRLLFDCSFLSGGRGDQSRVATRIFNSFTAWLAKTDTQLSFQNPSPQTKGTRSMSS